MREGLHSDSLEATTVPDIVRAYYGGRLVRLPRTFEGTVTRKVNGKSFTYKNKDDVLDVHPLRRTYAVEMGQDIPAGHQAFVRDSLYRKAFLLSLPK